MKALNYSSFLFEVIKARIFSQTKPLVVFLNVTNRCNLNCIYCYGDYHNRTAKDFTKEELFEIIENLSAMGTKLVHVSGGEPLIRTDIGEIIEKIKSEKMFCFMNSNGTLVPNRIEQIKKLDGLTISLDGDEQVNDSTRGKGTFKKVMKTLEILRNQNMRVSTNTVINRNNLDSLDTVVSLAKKMGFTAEFNLPYEQELGDKNNSVTSLTDEEIRKVLNKLIEMGKKGAPLSFSAGTRKYALNWPLPYNHKIVYNSTDIDGFEIINCEMGRLSCFIDSDGYVYPCGQLLGKFPAVNIREAGFSAAWDSLVKKKTCKTCYSMCFTEFNQLFGLKSRMIFSTARRFLK